jgi:hypothetical protein
VSPAQIMALRITTITTITTNTVISTSDNFKGQFVLPQITLHITTALH